MKWRYNMRNTMNHIYLKDVDNSNEWLIRESGYLEEDNDLVFDDGSFIWVMFRELLKQKNLPIILGQVHQGQ